MNHILRIVYFTTEGKGKGGEEKVMWAFECLASGLFEKGDNRSREAMEKAVDETFGKVDAHLVLIVFIHPQGSTKRTFSISLTEFTNTPTSIDKVVNCFITRFYNKPTVVYKAVILCGDKNGIGGVELITVKEDAVIDNNFWRFLWLIKNFWAAEGVQAFKGDSIFIKVEAANIVFLYNRNPLLREKGDIVLKYKIVFKGFLIFYGVVKAYKGVSILEKELFMWKGAVREDEVYKGGFHFPAV